MKEKIEELVKKYEPEIIAFAQDIVRTKSYSGEEGELVKLLEKKMKELGFDEVIIDETGNIIGRVGSGPIKLLYDAHIDTVWAEDKENWSVDPFGGIIKDGKLYGRGSSDEKVAIGCMIYGAKILKEVGIPENVSLYVMGSVQEEDCDGLSMYHTFTEVLKPDFVVLGEPTSLDVYRGHRGRVELEVIVKGKSSHAAHPDKGDNAIYKMAKTVLNIEELTKTFKEDPFLGKGTAVVSHIESKAPSINSVPYESRIFIDRRLTVGETKETALREIESALADPKNSEVRVLKYETKSWKGRLISQEKYFPTWVLEESHPLVQAGFETAKEVRPGEEVKISRWIFSTNGVTSMGKLNIPTIGFGPGDEWLAHAVDEYVRLSDLPKATAFYALMPFKLKEKLG
ncbi:MAG: YgeY family selenium metabolism-linked hydrolase [Caldisericum sp.]|uniref:YgeY family selenium metabolism-linked hydrolase n=1 Tax=Caldisericum sp. AR60 TaxID=3397852 RepID=UPI0039FC4093